MTVSIDFAFSLMTSNVGHSTRVLNSYLSGTPRARSTACARLRNACEARRGTSSQCLINWTPLISSRLPGLFSPSLVGTEGRSLTRIARVEGGLVDIIVCRHVAGTFQRQPGDELKSRMRGKGRMRQCVIYEILSARPVLAGLITLSQPRGANHVHYT